LVQQFIREVLNALTQILDQTRREDLLTSPRSRVWSGTSTSSMFRSSGLNISGCPRGCPRIDLVFAEAIIFQDG
jgi:hypothetical protein